MPGIWQVTVQASRTSRALSIPYSITARVQGVTLSPATVDLQSAARGAATDVRWTARNAFGPVTVAGRGGPLGSAVTGRRTIADGGTQTYTVDVPAGADRLDVAIGGARRLRARPPPRGALPRPGGGLAGRRGG